MDPFIKCREYLVKSRARVKRFFFSIVILTRWWWCWLMKYNPMPSISPKISHIKSRENWMKIVAVTFPLFFFDENGGRDVIINDNDLRNKRSYRRMHVTSGHLFSLLQNGWTLDRFETRSWNSYCFYIFYNSKKVFFKVGGFSHIGDVSILNLKKLFC